MIDLNVYWPELLREVEALRKEARKGLQTPRQGFLPRVAARKVYSLATDRRLGGYAQIDDASESITLVPTLNYKNGALCTAQTGAKWYLLVGLDLIGRRGELVGFIHRADMEYAVGCHGPDEERCWSRPVLYPYQGLPLRLPEKKEKNQKKETFTT